jgi:FkbM family methyltransferase
MLPQIVGRGMFSNDPFVLIDVGCALGLDPAWRRFGDDLHAHAFDPQLEEVERLQRDEKNPNVRYHSAFVGLADGSAVTRDDGYFMPLSRSSAVKALEPLIAAGGAPFHETDDWYSADLSSRTVGLGAFLSDVGVESVDFIKIDTDGAELEVLKSVDEHVRRLRVLGFMVETPFTGSDAETANTFHNIDRFMKRHGFLLAALSVNRYSRAVLPAPFVYNIFAQTTCGQPMWGDSVYLREVAHPEYARFGELSELKLLKLACLYELFSAPDCAVETLLFHRARLAPLVNVDRLLDLLTPRLNGRRLSYRGYLARFEEDPTSFFPTTAAARIQRVKELAAFILGPAVTKQLQRLRARRLG